MGMFVRRRRPVMRVAAGAATAGVAYNAGKRKAQSQSQPEEAAPAPAPAAAPAEDSTAELERLAQLHQSGALSDEEFAAAKAKVLGA